MEILMAYKDKSDDWFEISFDEFLDNTEGRNVCGKGWALYNLIALQKKQQLYQSAYAYFKFKNIYDLYTTDDVFKLLSFAKLQNAPESEKKDKI